jgi:hypothetical protein
MSEKKTDKETLEEILSWGMKVFKEFGYFPKPEKMIMIWSATTQVLYNMLIRNTEKLSDKKKEAVRDIVERSIDQLANEFGLVCITQDDYNEIEKLIREAEETEEE